MVEIYKLHIAFIVTLGYNQIKDKNNTTPILCKYIEMSSNRKTPKQPSYPTH